MNFKNSVSNMESKTLFETMEDSFDLLNPYEKALFIDARLAWSSGRFLCSEVHRRICSPCSDK